MSALNNTIILLVGESGSGKTAITHALEKEGFVSVESFTTRPSRYPGERGHIFISDAEFDALPKLVAYTEYNGHRYGATEQQVEVADIYVIDEPGIDYFMQTYQGTKHPRIIRLQVSGWDRFWRMLRRGDGFKRVVQRIRHDKTAFHSSRPSDLVLSNGSFDLTVRLFKCIAYWWDAREGGRNTA